MAILLPFSELAPACPRTCVALGELRGGWFGVQLELGCATVGFTPRRCGWEQGGAFGWVALLSVPQLITNN